MSGDALTVTISSKMIRIKATDPKTLEQAYREISDVNILKNYSPIFSEAVFFKRTHTDISIEALPRGNNTLWHACYFEFLSYAEHLRRQEKPFTPSDLRMCVWGIADRVLKTNEAHKYYYDVTH
ncbi:hypothetical protein PQU92_12100 [Asticcacaulis sp. BYS171W]|uniref:Uncharacterized protein n=1 Tax=Asticcacaulis aquaticus TaxID=2984212 RepID=A0ABT5HVS5_9CAUL|nr:hypothetical protein [Asticcacaulis aquaticus]MDC7684022.1 hypothetical protein [Asticcacaulis aquaticus]